MNIQDLKINKKAKDGLISLGLTTTELCIKYGVWNLRKLRYVGAKTLAVIGRQCSEESLCEQYEFDSHIEAKGAKEKIKLMIKLAKSPTNLIEINPEEIVKEIAGEHSGYIISRLGGQKAYNDVVAAFRSKMQRLLNQARTFDERWSIWNKSQRQKHTFINEEILKMSADAAVDCANVAQAILVWNKVRKTETGFRALERMAKMARTSKEYWEVAIIARKCNSIFIWKKSVLALARKIR